MKTYQSLWYMKIFYDGLAYDNDRISSSAFIMHH